MEDSVLRTQKSKEELPDNASGANAIGVVIVTYNSSDVIEECLSSLLDSDYPNLRIVICDNNSPDNTVEVIRRWASAQSCGFAELVTGGTVAPQPDPLPMVTLLRSTCNKGFAAGTNTGIKALMPHLEIELFWILNPDCVVTKSTASSYARAAADSPPFSLMGGRILYLDPPNYIQTDGGKINRWTGACSNTNQGLLPDTIALPDSDAIDFIPGANAVASRMFIETAGLMTEDYFLYFEEVDWAMRRGDLPLKLCPEALVYHHGGTAIGSGSISQRASGFSNYFNYRNRMIFMRRNFPAALPVAYLYSTLKIVKLVLLGAWQEALGAACGLHQLSPPNDVRNRLSSEAATWAFGRKSKAE